MSRQWLWVAALVVLVGRTCMAQWSRADTRHNSQPSNFSFPQDPDTLFQSQLNSTSVPGAGNTVQQTISAAQLRVPGKAQSALEKAERAFRKGNLREMDRQLDKAITLYPRYSEALAFRAAIELHQRSLDQARADAEAAVKNDPNWAKAYLVLGSTYTALKQYDDAIRVLDRALSLDPNDRWNYYQMALALLSKGDYTGALQYADRALTLSTHNDLACVHLLKAGAYVALRKQTSANQELKRIQELKPVDPNILKSTRILERINASFGEE